MNYRLLGQEAQKDLIFIGHELYQQGFFHSDRGRHSLHWGRFCNFFSLTSIMFFFQIYFIHHIIILNSQSINTAFNVSKIDDADTDIYKMFTYTTSKEKIPSVLHFFKENEDEAFDNKYGNKDCDAAAATDEQAVIGLKK